MQDFFPCSVSFPAVMRGTYCMLMGMKIEFHWRFL